MDSNDAYRIAVIKIGSNTLTNDEGKCDHAFLADLAHQIHRVRRAGWRPIVVSSGAIACGLEELGMPAKRPDDMPSVQAASSVGQRALVSAYDRAFSPYGMLTSLVLLTRRDTADRSAYLHARDTFRRLVELDVVPIVNENDTVSLEQIKFGDNDTLAALVACLADADRVVLLSDIDGLYDSNPRTNPSAQLIKCVKAITPEILAGASGAGSVVGSGGMVTKLTAARVLCAAGIPMVICAGRAQDAIVGSLEDEPIGTLFCASSTRHQISPRKLWIALADSVRGSVVVDDGARSALLAGGGSLLRVGIARVEGSFVAGDTIDVKDASGFPIGRGLAKASSAQLAQGDTDVDVVIHRDELILFE